MFNILSKDSKKSKIDVKMCLSMIIREPKEHNSDLVVNEVRLFKKIDNFILEKNIHF